MVSLRVGQIGVRFPQMHNDVDCVNGGTIHMTRQAIMGWSRGAQHDQGCGGEDWDCIVGLLRQLVVM